MVTAIQNFYESIKTDATKRVYEIYLKQFWAHSKKTPNKLLKMNSKAIEKLVFDYIVRLKRSVEAGDLNPNSINTVVSPIQLFLEQNDVTLNWKKLKRLFPRRIAPANQLPYENKEIQKMLQATTSIRSKALIHFLASSGCRIGALGDLKFRNMKPVEDGCVVYVYDDDVEAYRTCLTPEAYTALKDYFEYRNFHGEVLRDDSPVFANISGFKPMSYDSLKDFMKQILKSAGLRKKGSESRGKKHAKSQNHAFRKRFETILVMAEIHPKLVEFMMGHKVGQDRSYLVPSDEGLYQQFKKAIPELTISKENRLRELNKKQQVELSNYEKDARDEIQSLKKGLTDVKLETLKMIGDAINDPEEFKRKLKEFKKSS